MKFIHITLITLDLHMSKDRDCETKTLLAFFSPHEVVEFITAVYMGRVMRKGVFKHMRAAFAQSDKNLRCPLKNHWTL